VTSTKRRYFRAMKPREDGRPRCGDTGATLGVRPRDLAVGGDGFVHPGKGGLSITPDDPLLMPEEFRPHALGGIGRLPVFEISEDAFGPSLAVRPDAKKPARHAFVEPQLPMPLQDYKRLLCATAPNWRPIT